MPRPKAGYLLQNGTRVPGVTTIISMLKGDPGGLITWAWKLGRDGKDLKEEREKATGAGTLAHALIEADILGQPPTKPLTAADFDVTNEMFAAMQIKAETAFGAYRSWRAAVRLTIVATETPLVSETYCFGGTPDAVAFLNDDLVILDWKAANGIYPEYIAQIAAYAHLWAECKGDLPKSAHLLRIGKDEGDFHYHYWPDTVLATAWDAFRKCHDLYELKAKLKKVC